MKHFVSKSLSALVFFLFFMISCESNKSIDYQNTKKNPVVDSYFGTEVIDNYRWLEDDMSKETENWVTKQNETTFDYLNEISLREQLKNRLTDLWDYEKISSPFKEGKYTYFYKNTGLQNQSVLYRSKLKGEEEGFKYLQKFNEQVRQYTKSGSAPGRMVGMGEAPIALGFLHDAIKYQEEGYTDIIFTAAEEGTGYEIGAVGIIKGGPDQEAARMFVDWALSKEAQELGKTVGSFQFLTNSDATPPEQALSLKETKLIDYDFQWAGDNRSVFLERFMELTKTTPPTK